MLVWDVASLAFIRQLGPHSGAVSALTINESTGDIASASGTVRVSIYISKSILCFYLSIYLPTLQHIYVWSINGELLAAVNCQVQQAAQQGVLLRSQQVRHYSLIWKIMRHTLFIQVILSLMFSTLREWDPLHVIAAGSNDGIVRFWSMELVQASKSVLSHHVSKLLNKCLFL